MIHQRIESIIGVLNQFDENGGEPKNDTERYILKSMWVMMLSEFEGSIKDVVETYIDKVKTTGIEQIHACILLKQFNPRTEGKSAVDNLILAYKEDPTNITYDKFTRDSKPKYKSKPVERLFNSLGIFFSEEELISLRQLNSIASTRDEIAHGDHSIQITTKELKNRLLVIEDIFNMLKKKLFPSGE